MLKPADRVIGDLERIGQFRLEALSQLSSQCGELMVILAVSESLGSDDCVKWANQSDQYNCQKTRKIYGGPSS